MLYWQQRIGYGSLRPIVLAGILIEIDLIDIFDVIFVINLISMEHLLHLVDGIRIDFLLQVCLLIEWLECFQYFILRVDEIQNKGVFLIRMTAIQAR